MTWGNRLFWSIMIFFGLHLFWLGLVERFAPLWIATIIGVGFGVWFMVYGPRPKDQQTGNRKGF